MITREDMVEQSVQDYMRQGLVDRGYADDVVVLEAFPYDEPAEGPANYLAFGFGFDDGGEQAEVGSDLKRCLYTIQFWIFGRTNTLARNIANVVKFALEEDGLIPLKDISQDGGPVIDQLVVENASRERQYIPDPEPWQEFVWTVHLRLTDEYHASLA